MAPTPLLFEPMTLRSLELRNRIWVAPMCQYAVTAQDGVPTDVHLAHYGARASGGAALVIAEATGVLPEGRISPRCVGLWNDEQATAFSRIASVVHDQGAAMGIQLAHAGRKGSTFPAWPSLFAKGTVPQAQGGWQTVGPTQEPFPTLDAPHALTVDEIRDIVDAFAAAARRAVEAGIDLIELHAAHGYLLHQFLTPLVNTRTDEYGGDLAGRSRLLREVLGAVRDAVGEQVPVTVRISATDHIDGGWDVEDSIALATQLATLGLDAVHVSTGGAVPVPGSITVGPGYQVPQARRIREALDVPVAAVGLITEPVQAESILVDGSADVIAIGRVALREPSWPLRAARELGADPQRFGPEAYARALR